MELFAITEQLGHFLLALKETDRNKRTTVLIFSVTAPSIFSNLWGKYV